MKHAIKPAVIGGTGKSGKYLVKALIEQGYHFKLLVRNPDHLEIKSPLMEVIHGDVQDENAVKKLIESCNAVISTLGLGIPASEPDLFTKATANILRAMEALHVQRYIITTGLNVDAPSDHKSEQAKAATEWMRQNYPVSTANKQKEYEMLASSHVAWTMVRLPMIDLTDVESKIGVNLHDCPYEKVSAASLARFLIGQLTDQQYEKQAPFIGNL